MADLYLITSPSGKQYVGITKRTTAWRWECHKRSTLKSQKRNSALYAAMRKYQNWDEWVVETLYTGSWGDVAWMERQLILNLDTQPPNGYNIDVPGGGVQRGVLGPEFAEKCRQRALRQWQDPEFRDKLRAVHKSEEFREKMSVVGRENGAKTDQQKYKKGRIKMWANPKYRKRHAEGQRRRFLDPEARKQHGELIAAGMRRKRYGDRHETPDV